MVNNYVSPIIKYWTKFLYSNSKNNNMYSFLPVSRFKHSLEHRYTVDIRMFLQKDFADHYQGCFFVKREELLYVLINEFGFLKYNNNIGITANMLWQNRKDNRQYILAWLYALCANIIRQKEYIPLCSNEAFYNYIIEMHKFLISQECKKCYMSETYLAGNAKYNKVLPDGLLFNDYYNIDENHTNIGKQVAKILLTEMLYILNTNYLIVY